MLMTKALPTKAEGMRLVVCLVAHQERLPKPVVMPARPHGDICMPLPGRTSNLVHVAQMRRVLGMEAKLLSSLERRSSRRKALTCQLRRNLGRRCVMHGQGLLRTQIMDWRSLVGRCMIRTVREQCHRLHLSFKLT